MSTTALVWERKPLVVNSYMKVVSNQVKEPHNLFPFNRDDYVSTTNAWLAARALMVQLPGARIAVDRLPGTPGPWSHANIIGEPVEGTLLLGDNDFED